MALTVDSLLDITPIVDDERDIVQLAARHLLLGQVKVQPSVRETFFPNARRDDNSRYNEEVTAAMTSLNINDYAVLCVCQAICRLRDEFGIYELLDAEVVDSKLSAAHNSFGWKKVGFALYTMLFPDLVKDENTRIPFRRYMEKDPQLWAKRLCDRVRDKKWVYRYLQPVITGTMSRDVYNRDINILFVKLHLLDPKTVVTTFDYLSKALPDISLELATTNYLGPPLEWTLIRDDIAAVIKSPSFPSNASRLRFDDVELYYGIRVCEFIMLEARRLELWSGKYVTGNKRTSRFSDRCAIS